MIRTGIDLIEVARVEAALAQHGERFLERCFTAQEQADCAGRPASLAARFAAKEAVAKALGCGIGAVSWLDIEIVSGPEREPQLRLLAAAQERADQLGLTDWAISLSHTHEHAIAVAVAQGEKEQP